MKWIKADTPPPPYIEGDMYRSCITANMGLVFNDCDYIDYAVPDSVYCYETDEYYHNMDTSHTNPLTVTHWMLLTPSMEEDNGEKEIIDGFVGWFIYQSQFQHLTHDPVGAVKKYLEFKKMYPKLHP